MLPSIVESSDAADDAADDAVTLQWRLYVYKDEKVWPDFVWLTFDALFLGSYDHTVKLFDARVEKSVITMDHGQPVESVLLYPSEGLLVSAGSHQYNSYNSNNDCLLSSF